MKFLAKDSKSSIRENLDLWNLNAIRYVVCIYCKLLHTSLFGMQVHLTTKLMYLMTAYYAPNEGFTANNALLYKNNGGYSVSILHVAVTFHLIVYTNIKFIIKNTSVPLYDCAT